MEDKKTFNDVKKCKKFCKKNGGWIVQSLEDENKIEWYNEKKFDIETILKMIKRNNRIMKVFDLKI